MLFIKQAHCLEEQFACHLKPTLHVISELFLSPLCICIQGRITELIKKKI